MNAFCISYHDCNLFQTLLRELQKCNDKYNMFIMHVIFNIGIGFMIVKRQTWLNNTKRYRAHIYIYIYIHTHMYIYIGVYKDNRKEHGSYYILYRGYIGIMEKKMKTTTLS